MRQTTALVGLVLGTLWIGLGSARAEPQPEGPGRVAVLRVDEWGAPRWVKGSLGRLDLEDLDGSARVVVARLAREYFGASGEEGLRFDRLNRDTFGRAHLRFEQRLRGLRVVGAALVLHVDLAKGEAVGVHGRFAPELGRLPRTPDLGPEEALERAASEVGLVEAEIADDRELVYFLAHDTEQPYLAWTATVSYSQGGMRLSDSVFADASTGALVGRYHHQAPAKKVETYDLQNMRQYYPNSPGLLVLSTNTGNPPEGVADAVAHAAHDNASRYYDALAGLFGRDSTDGQGEILGTAIREFTLSGLNIFLADFTRPAVHMTEGDGVRYAVDVPRAFDLVAHEQSHILVHRAGALGYSKADASASLHEALADIFAATTETYPNPNPTSGTWKVFQDVYTPGILDDAARYMDDPVRDGASVDHFSEFSLSGSREPHHNAGILNLVFFLLTKGGSHPQAVVHGSRVTVQGQGIRAAGAIFYNAMLSMVSDFEEFRIAALEAAISGFGQGSTQHQATHDAFCEVGFDCEMDLPPTAAFNVKTKLETVTFDASATNDEDEDDLLSYAWDFGDGTTGVGKVVAHTYSSDGRYRATLTVTDTLGQTDSFSLDVKVISTRTLVTLFLRGRDTSGSSTESTGGSSMQSRREPGSGSPEIGIDQPAEGSVIGGPYSVGGFALAGSGVATVTTTLDGEPLTLAGFAYGTARVDICAAFPAVGDPNCPNVGWTGHLDTTVIPNGSHTLAVTVVDSAGNSRTVQRSFVVANRRSPRSVSREED